MPQVTVKRGLAFTLAVATTLVVSSAAEVDPGREEAQSATSQAQLDADASTKSIGFYVGRNLTEDGSVLLGGFGHEPSSHWLEIVPRRQFPEDATTTVGVTDAASYPGELTEIPQARRTARYITSNYSEFAGFPAPLTNGGLNEHGVAARDIWSPSSDRLLEMTDDPQRGPNYSDLARIAMERARTAREAVEIVGSLIDEYGFSTYGGNSHLFADENEGWVLVNYGGSQGLWAAQRLGPNEIRVSYPGYLEPFPLDYQERPEQYLASPNFIEFAVEQGWFDPEQNDRFDPQEVYAGWQPNDREITQTHPWGNNIQGELEEELREDLGPVSLRDLLAYVRDPRWSHDRSGYGQVAQLRDRAHADLNPLWTSVTGAVTTPYVPIYIGAEDVPAEFKQHRYLTSDSASTYLDADYAALEATRYATRTFKRLMYHTCENPEMFYEPVTAEIEGFEQELIDRESQVARRAQRHLDAGRQEQARTLLTDTVHDSLRESLQLGERLVEAVEHRTRQRFGVRLPSGDHLPGETSRPESQSMALSEGEDIVWCYREGLGVFPREHRSYQGKEGQLLDVAVRLARQEWLDAKRDARERRGSGK